MTWKNSVISLAALTSECRRCITLPQIFTAKFCPVLFKCIAGETSALLFPHCWHTYTGNGHNRYLAIHWVIGRVPIYCIQHGSSYLYFKWLVWYIWVKLNCALGMSLLNYHLLFPPEIIFTCLPLAHDNIKKIRCSRFWLQILFNLCQPHSLIFSTET